MDIEGAYDKRKVDAFDIRVYTLMMVMIFVAKKACLRVGGMLPAPMSVSCNCQQVCSYADKNSSAAAAAAAGGAGAGAGAAAVVVVEVEEAEAVDVVVFDSYAQWDWDKGPSCEDTTDWVRHQPHSANEN